MSDRFTITLFSENIPGLLQRVTAIFTRRKINIESLTVSETELHDISRYTIVVFTDDDAGRKLVDQIRRIVEVREAYGKRDSELLAQEISYTRVDYDNEETYNEIKKIVQDNNAIIAHTAQNSVIVQMVGRESDIDKILSDLSTYKISEFIRSGRIAVTLEGKEKERESVTQIEKPRNFCKL